MPGQAIETIPGLGEHPSNKGVSVPFRLKTLGSSKGETQVWCLENNQRKKGF